MEFISNLAKKLKAYMPEDTVLVVSSMDEGRRILKACAEQEGLLVGVRALTSLAIAQELCGSLLNKAGAPRLLENGAEKDIIFECLKSMPKVGFFELEHAYDRKTAELMLEAINELENSCIFDVKGNFRLEAVEKVRKSYIEAKRQANVIDRYDLIDMGLGEAVGSKVFENTHFVILGNTEISRSESLLFGSFRNKGTEVVKLDYPEATPLPRNIKAEGLSEKPINRDKLEFYRCRSSETEQRFIMRDILANGYNLEDCAVVFLSSDYAKGLKEAAAFYKLPITISGGVPLTGSSIYSIYSSLADWYNSNYNAEVLRSMIINGALYFQDGFKFCKWMRDVNVGWGGNRYLELLDKEIDKKNVSDEDKERFAGWRKSIENLLQSVNPNGTLEDQKVALGRLLYKKNASEPSAYGMAKGILKGINYLDEGETVLSRLLESMKEAHYQSGAEAPGKLFCVPLKKAFCTGRKNLYICGMNRFSMQGGKAESPIILDADKKALGLDTSIDCEIANNFRLKLLLLTHEGRVVISYNDFDAEKMIELQPAPLLRDLKGNKEIKKISYIPEGAEYTIGDSISKGISVGLITEKIEASEDAKGMKLENVKEYATQFKERSLSASSLETALTCPLKFYLQKIIGLNPPQFSESSEDAWLDAAEMGTLCHKVLERYYKENASGYEDILKEEIEKLKRERPLARESAIIKDTEKALAMIENGIAWTSKNKHKIVATEKGFGYNAEKEEDNQPLEIQIGTETIRMSGSIDRLDQLEDGQLAVVDYKTGSSSKYKDHEATNLQPYLYALAAEKLYADKGIKITKAGYLFLRGYAEYLADNQAEEKRKVKERTVLDLLKWMQDEKQAQTPCPAFIIDEKGAIVGPGEAEAADKYYENCSKYCDFKEFCDSIRKTVVKSEVED